jgi:anti-sigma regulatory factor (Ser/Thr protein kinase)
VKNIPFDFYDLRLMLDNLLNETIFGVDRFFSSRAQRERFSIRSASEVETMVERVVDTVPEEKRKYQLKLVLSEMVSNAFFHGVGEGAADDDEVLETLELDETNTIDISLVYDTEKYAVSIIDTGGKLTKKSVLYWLNRQSACDDRGIPVGLTDTHGRGFFLSRKYIDKMMINVERKKKTEIIIFNYLSNVYTGNKPIYINEI